MLDIKLFRDNPDIIKESERKRFRSVENVEKVIEFDKKWRNSLQKLQDLRALRNKLSKQFPEAAKKGKDKISELKTKSKEIKNQIDELEPKVDEYLNQRDLYRYKIGNILSDDVPVAEDEKGDQIIRMYGDISRYQNPKSHVDLISEIDGVELTKASEIAGSRFYYLKGDIVLLNLALIRYALDKLVIKGYTPFWTPFFTKHEVMKEAAELAEFEEQLYKIENEDLYLIATSEQTLAPLHRNEVLDEKTLPRKYCAVSTCFRREAGSHGRDTLGIFRVHQFEKVEQFIFCTKEQAEELHMEILNNLESIFKDLEIPYRIVNIASGELNDNAAKKYDLEGYFPGSQKYRELGSCTNCKDYQGRKLNSRYGTLGDKTTFKEIYTLNSTAIATERAICCILENCQKLNGTIQIPKVLIPYMNGKTYIGKEKFKDNS